MSYVLTANDNKTESQAPRDLTCSQMCFDWTNETLSGNSDILVLTAEPAVAQVWTHRGTIREYALSGPDQYPYTNEREHYFYWWDTSWTL